MKSSTWIRLACWSRAPIRASSRNIDRYGPPTVENARFITLIATGRANTSLLRATPCQTVDRPPSATTSTSWYRPPIIDPDSMTRILADPAAQPIAEPESLPAQADRRRGAGEDDPGPDAQRRRPEHREGALHGELQGAKCETTGDQRPRGGSDVAEHRRRAGPARPQHPEVSEADRGDRGD